MKTLVLSVFALAALGCHQSPIQEWDDKVASCRQSEQWNSSVYSSGPSETGSSSRAVMCRKKAGPPPAYANGSGSSPSFSDYGLRGHRNFDQRLFEDCMRRPGGNASVCQTQRTPY